MHPRARLCEDRRAYDGTRNHQALIDFGKRKHKNQLELSSLANPLEEIAKLFFHSSSCEVRPHTGSHMCSAYCDWKTGSTTAGPAAILPNSRLLDQWIRHVPPIEICCMWILHLREFGSPLHSLIDRRARQSLLRVIRRQCLFVKLDDSCSLVTSINLGEVCIPFVLVVLSLPLHQRLRCPWFPRSSSLVTVSCKTYFM